MTGLIAGGVAAAIAAIAIWIALRQAKQSGASEQTARDAELARETEAAIHQVQAENRDTDVTLDRLKKGTF
jgi:type VI protein secretion system component VasK